MPAGMPYFAWVDPGETAFGPEHLRWDEQVFSFTLKQDEGDPASLTLVVRRPRNEAGNAIGLLGPGRKIWAWFALDCGPDLIKFRGRLVGVPTSIFEELVTLEFVARPTDLVAQKESLAETLRVLPHYDEVMLDKERRKDPDVVLEGYTKIWHYDRETHVLTVSDEVTGEDGLVEFDGASAAGTVLYDGLGLSLQSGPLTRIDVKAEFTWTQQGRGNVDLTKYLTTNSPHFFPNTIASYSLTADNWTKTGATLGEGWVAAAASCYDLYNLESVTLTDGYGSTVKLGDGETSTTTVSWTASGPAQIPPGSKMLGSVIKSSWSVTPGKGGSIQSSYSQTTTYMPMHHIVPRLVAGYDAKRQCTERVSFSLFADIQHVLTEPEDGEALLIDDLRSVNLSETIGEGSDAYLPIGDPRRRSYIATDRGNQSLEYLIAMARAHLMKRARVVEWTFAPKLERMPEITLRKNVFLTEPRIGEALGKIIGYSISLDGSDGRISCSVRIGCTIGRGGSAVAAGGTPTYCSMDYTGDDYQQFLGRTVLFDSSVGYQPPNANPNDDGLNFLSVFTVADVIDIPLIVEHGPAEQAAIIDEQTAGYKLPRADAVSEEEVKNINRAHTVHANNIVDQYQMRLIFKLKSMNREFLTDYEIPMTDLMIPTGYNLEAA